MNVGAPWPDLDEAEHRVLVMQTKLHQWAATDRGRRFDDLANLVYDPAFLVVAWARVRGNKGARTAGVDGVAPRLVVFGAAELLGGLREDRKAGRFVPQRVREKTIPKASGKVRSLGIPTAVDRVVQASLKLVLEPIFEAAFKPCSYGFRPKYRAQDAIAEIHYFGSPTRDYEWVFEADIKACFDEIDHTALIGRVRHRIGDKRVLGWVKAFLRAGILTEEGRNRETITGTPQGGILSPLLANIALSVLDEHFAARWAALGPSWTRAKRRRAGEPVMKLVRYADDFVVMVHGTRDDAEALRGEVSSVLAPMGLRLSEEKTRVCHIGEGFDFLGWRIQRRSRRGRTGKTAIYTYPSKKSMASIKDKVRTLTRRAKHRTLADLLRRLNPVLRGWCSYFRHGVCKRTFSYIDHFAFWRVVGWLRKRHLGRNMHTLVRRYLPGWEISGDGIEMFRPNRFAIERYRYRGTKIPDTLVEHSDRITRTSGMNTRRAGCGESRTSGSEGGPQKPTRRKPGRALRSDPYTEHRTREGKVYCAVVLDTFSRRVVGWSIDSSPTSALATNALSMAIENRTPTQGSGLIVHSDQGPQFTSWAFTRRARESGLLPSMGSVGDCFDNAVIESFWGRMQTELLNRRRWRTRIERANAMFDYLKIFHNRQRRHSALGMLTPTEFETRHLSIA